MRRNHFTSVPQSGAEGRPVFVYLHRVESARSYSSGRGQTCRFLRSVKMVRRLHSAVQVLPSAQREVCRHIYWITPYSCPVRLRQSVDVETEDKLGCRIPQIVEWQNGAPDKRMICHPAAAENILRKACFEIT